MEGRGDAVKIGRGVPLEHGEIRKRMERIDTKEYRIFILF